MRTEYKLKHSIDLPSHYGKIVEDYLKVLSKDTKYDAWTIDDELRVVKCKGIIKSNGSWNYHNNYDNSEDELYCIIGTQTDSRWFTLNEKEAIQIQKKNLDKWKETIGEELTRIKKIQDGLK